MLVDDWSAVTPVPTHALPTLPPPPDAYNVHRDQHTPLIIDNGATHLRWGFATSSSPRYGPNAISKYKERRNNKPLLLFGDAIDVESGAKAQSRSAWEGDVLLNFDALVCPDSTDAPSVDELDRKAQENALDYAFVNLGIDTPTVDHPILMTERLSTPLHSRACMCTI